MISSGMICNFSKPSAHKPMMNPNNENVSAVSNKNNAAQNGCATVTGTNKALVARITKPIKIDLTAAAPTNPITISSAEMGADKYS